MKPAEQNCMAISPLRDTQCELPSGHEGEHRGPATRGDYTGFRSWRDGKPDSSVFVGVPIAHSTDEGDGK